MATSRGLEWDVVAIGGWNGNLSTQKAFDRSLFARSWDMTGLSCFSLQEAMLDALEMNLF